MMVTYWPAQETLKAELLKQLLIMQANVIFLFPDLISNRAYSIFYLGANMIILYDTTLFSPIQCCKTMSIL